MKRQLNVPLFDVFGNKIDADDMALARTASTLQAWVNEGMPSDDASKKRVLDALKDREQLTLPRAIATALTTRYRGEEEIEGKTLLDRYSLAARVLDDAKAGALTDLDSGQMETIKKLLVKAGFSTAVIATAYRVLDTEPVPTPGEALA